MKHDDERWQQAVRALSVEGPAPVPEGLAARAAAFALAAPPPPTLGALLSAEVLRLAPRALVAGAVVAVAALVVAAAVPAAPATTTARASAAPAASATSIRGALDAAFTVVDDDELATRLFGAGTQS